MNLTKWKTLQLAEIQRIVEKPGDTPEDAPDQGAEDTADAPENDDMFAKDEPKPVEIKFNISRVKRYNPSKKFSKNTGFVTSITAKGVEVQADNYAVIHVNFEDILTEGKSQKINEAYKMPQANDTHTHLVNFWNEYGPEKLAELDNQTIQQIQLQDPEMGRDLLLVKQVLAKLNVFINSYYDKYLTDQNPMPESRLIESSKLTQLLRKFGWYGETWTPQEFASQIKKLPDNVLIMWSKDTKGIPGTPLHFQQKLVKIEMDKRGLKEYYIKEDFDSKLKIKYDDSEETKPDKLEQDSKTELVTRKKAFETNELKVSVGTEKDYTDSLSTEENDIAQAKMLANALRIPDQNVYPTSIDILTRHVDPDEYDNPYANDIIDVTMSNSDKIKIRSYSGFAVYNPSVKKRKLVISVGSTDIMNTDAISDWLPRVGAVYSSYLKSKKAKDTK